VVIADDIRRHVAAVIGHHLGRVRLDHEIADGQDQTIGVYHDGRALALAPERRGGCARPD